MALPAHADTAVRFLKSVTGGKPELDLLASDATWWILGGSEAAMLPFLEGLKASFPNPGGLEIVGVTAQDDRVAVEARSSIDLGDGRTYANEYHFLVEMREGLVARVREYCNTAYVNRFFGGDFFGS